MTKSFLIGIAGGSGSGKTTLANKLLAKLGHDNAICITHDHYYKDQSQLTLEERKLTNYDHPNAYDTNLLIKDLKTLISNQSINRPTYDFLLDTRSPNLILLASRPIIIVEGILIFENSDLRNLFDLKVFVDTDSDIRLIRRFTRDIDEFNRSYEYVVDKYLTQVRPMYLEYVEPYKKYADQVITADNINDKIIGALFDQISAILK
ncbi:MAG: uridine kinase [bacterium]